MVAFSEHICDRKTEVYGTRGQLVWDDAKGLEVRHFDFVSKESKIYTCEKVSYEHDSAFSYTFSTIYI